MKASIYIIVDRHGVERMCKTASFQLKPGERAFELELSIPDEVFSPPRLPKVRMSIPREALITELDVEASVEGGSDASPE